MTYLKDLFTNPLFLSAGSAWFISQALKMILETLKGGFHPERLSGGGGMPSAHSATVTGLAGAALLRFGAGGFEFVMALFFAIIVIYDAMGVRYETGQEARILNLLRKRDQAKGEPPLFEKPLDEKMGHTLPEIIAGCAIGIICSVAVSHLPFV